MDHARRSMTFYDMKGGGWRRTATVASWAYEVLGLEPTASDQAIKEAYLRLARQFHPDQHPDASPEEREYWEDAMRQLNDAHDCLRDPSVTAAARSQDAPKAAVWTLTMIQMDHAHRSMTI